MDSIKNDLTSDIDQLTDIVNKQSLELEDYKNLTKILLELGENYTKQGTDQRRVIAELQAQNETLVNEVNRLSNTMILSLDNLESGLNAVKNEGWLSRKDIKHLSRTELVYIIAAQEKNGCANYFKIGITQNLSSRMEAIYTSTPFEPKLVFHKKTKNMLKLEREAHSFFNECRCTGEWFLFNEAKLKEAKEFLQRN